MVGDEPCLSDGLHEVELLLPFMKDASVEGMLALPLILSHINLFDLSAPKILILMFICLSIFGKACSQKEVVGILVFSGSVCSFACLNPKEPISQALADIKVLNSCHFLAQLVILF